MKNKTILFLTSIFTFVSGLILCATENYVVGILILIVSLITGIIHIKEVTTIKF